MGGVIRLKTPAFLFGFSILATVFVATISAVSAHKQNIVWHYGQTCVMSEDGAGMGLGSTRIGSTGQVIDIHELYDKRNRVVGLVYVTNKGTKIYQANWLMPLADIYRLQLHYDAWGWSDESPFDAALLGYPERECLPSHLTDGATSNRIVSELQRKAYLEGLDFIPDPRSAWKDIRSPVVVLDKELREFDEQR